VPNPYPETSLSKEAASKDEADQNKQVLNPKSMDELRNLVHEGPPSTNIQNTDRRSMEVNEKLPREIQTESEKPALPTRPPMDIFKAIFDNSDDEESDEEDDKKDAKVSEK
jgi:hypothetical protein